MAPRRRKAVWLALCALLAGCGDDGESVDTDPAVVQACAAGEREQSDGRCLAAGIGDDCGAGWIYQQDACVPILPPDPCPTGRMALPGETDCRAVMPCGEGSWGNIPVEADTVYVDESYGDGNSDGSSARPYTTIGPALLAAPSGGMIAIAAGSYREDVFIDERPLRIWGRCPELVEIVGQDPMVAAVSVIIGPSEVHGVAATGAGAGIVAANAMGVLVDRVHVHHTQAFVGIGAQADFEPTQITVRDSLVEWVVQSGIAATGADMIVERSVVRDPLRGDGSGLRVTQHPQSAFRPHVELRDSVFERNASVAVYIEAADAIIERVVIRDTQPNMAELLGHGITVRDGVFNMDRANATVRDSLVERSHALGIQVADADATIERTAVRDTFPQASDQTQGGGVQVTAVRGSVPAVLSMRDCLVHGGHDIGILGAGATLALEGVRVRDVDSDAAGGLGGIGIAVQITPMAGMRSTGSIIGCLVERTRSTGIGVFGSDATISNSAVIGTRARSLDQLFGRGITVQRDPSSTERSTVNIDGCLIDDNHDIGVLVYASDTTVTASTIRNTKPRLLDGGFGDGVAVESEPQQAASLTLVDSRIASSGRAGIANFSASATLQGSSIQCNAIDLNGEKLDTAFSFDDRGGNRCGCDAEESCHVLSSNLEPPEAQ